MHAFSDHPLRDIVYQLAQKIGTTVRWAEEVENMRKNTKMVSAGYEVKHFFVA